VLAAQLLVEVVLDKVELPVQGIECAGQTALAGGHLREASADREALSVLCVAEVPICGIHRVPSSNGRSAGSSALSRRRSPSFAVRSWSSSRLAG
jgi:hypothetical protein